MSKEYRNDFLTKVQHFAPGAGADLIAAIENLDDTLQHETEKNLIQIQSRTWPENVLWRHIETNGLRVDR